MSKEDTGNQEDLREMLYFFLDKMGATQVELSEGMGVSRPVVIDFLNKQKGRLPVDSEGLIQLCKTLHTRKASKRKPKREESIHPQEDSEFNPDKLRRLLGEIGADELLEAAGFLPTHTKSIRVTRERFFQVAQVAALLELLKFDDLISTSQEFLAIASNKIAIASKNLFQDYSEYQVKDSLKCLIDNLWDSHPTLGLKLRLEVIKKLKRIWSKLQDEGKVNFTQQEAIALFLSVVIKEQIPRDVANLHIRIQKLEFQTLSHSVSYEDKYQDVYYKFIQIAHQAECELKTLGAHSTTLLKAKSLDSLYPVIRAIVTCSFSHDNQPNELLKWTYTSSNTMVENAISACSLNMGLDKEVANITLSTKTLDSNINSLVETTAILGSRQQYQGIWVDRDSMMTILQAIVCAAKQWIADESRSDNLDLDFYSFICKTLSQLRNQLIKAKISFQNLQFLDPECQIGEIKKIAYTAKEVLKKIPHNQTYFSYRLNFYRCYFLAKLIELRLDNIQGNIINAGVLIQEIQKVLEQEQEIKEDLAPIQALFQAEVYLYQLSCGHEPDLFEPNKRSQWLGLKEWDKKIRGGIKPGSCYKDPGLDVYQALSEIYGNVARIEFYMSNEKNTLEETVEHFFRAAHYALRIGFTQRAARWMALAGRVWVRLGDRQCSMQALSFAETFAKVDLTTSHSHNFRQANLSEIYLLHGEYLLLIEDNATQGLEYFLMSLKGSLYLGLNRRICDALFNIARCSKRLGNFSIKEGLSRIFKEDDQLNEANKSKLNPMSNHTSEKVLSLLYSLWNRDDNPTWFQVRSEFAKLAADTWQEWHQDTLPEAGTKHPIARLIESESWLKRVD